MPPISRQLAALLLSLFLSPTLPADTLTGKVVKVVGGDTVYILGSVKTQHKIRLAGGLSQRSASACASACSPIASMPSARG